MYLKNFSVKEEGLKRRDLLPGHNERALILYEF